MHWAWLGLIGLGAGGFGTLIGVGGGIILVPVLLFIYPDKTPETITAITLSVVFANTISGSIAYSRLHRIDYRSALLFSLAGIPGSILGANLSSSISRGLFQTILAGIIIVVAIYLMVRPGQEHKPASSPGSLSHRSLTDRDQNRYSYSFNLPLALGLSFIIGIASSAMGIGGGVFHVPVMTHVLAFPTHIATATSHLIIAITSLAAVGVHITSGAVGNNLSIIVPLALGSIVGAQLGARLSQKLSGNLIMRLLALGLVTLGIRLLLTISA